MMVINHDVTFFFTFKWQRRKPKTKEDIYAGLYHWVDFFRFIDLKWHIRWYIIALLSYYKSSNVCLFVCLFVPYLLRGPLTDLRQTWWVYVGGPRNCPWGVLFRKGQRLGGSTGHFRFPLYYICTSLMPHAATAPLACSSKSLIRHLLLDGYCTAPQQCI